MAQLKDLLVAGPSRFIGDMFGNTLQITKVLAPTTSGGSTYGAGSNNQVLRTNGASIYWGSNVTSNEVYMNWSNPTTPNTDKQINLTVNGATAGTIKFVAGSNVTLTAVAGSPNTITIASSYTNSRDPGYGGIKVGANSTAVTAVTAQSSDVTLAAKTYNETYTFKPVNKWIMLQGTNSGTAGSDVINIGHALALTTGTAGTTYGQASAATPALGGGTFKVPNVAVDAAGHVTAVGEATITMPSYTNSRDPGYGQIKVGANSSALTAVTAQSSDVTIQAASYNELFTFKPVNKWVMLQGTNSGTAGSDVINIGHALSAQTAGTFGSTDNQTPAHGATFNVPYLKTDAAGHVTEAGTKTVTLPADNDHRDSGYGQIKVGANSSAVTAVTAQASDVTIQAATYNELFTFKPVNKWVMLQGTNSGTAGSDVINIGHTLSGVTKGTYGSTSAQTPGYGATFTVPYITVDEAGHVTAAGTATTKIPAAHNGYGGIKVVKNSTAVTAPTSLSSDVTITAAAPNETFTFQPENKWVGLYASNSGTAGSDVIKIGHVLSSQAAGTFGSTSNQTPAVESTFSVPYLKTDAAGHITEAGAKTVTLPALGDAYLRWGGANFSGDFSPLDAVFNNKLRGNRFAGFDPSGTTVQYSSDGGSTWTNSTDSVITNAMKKALFTTSTSLRLVQSGNVTNNSQLRIIMDTGAGGVYTYLRKIMIYVNTNYSSGCKVTIEAALQNAPDNYTLKICENQPLSGWSGWNVINTGFTTFGNTAASQYGRIRFTFKHNSITSGREANGLIISSIYGYGGVGWAAPSTLAYTDHVYTFDQDFNVTFPNKVTANNGFVGNLSGNATSASYPEGFSSMSTNATWGNQTGTTVTAWNESSGGSIDFRRNNPSSGKLSIKVDGRFYGAEGNKPAMLLTSANEYWGMGDPDGNDNVWIRTTTQGIIPYQSGGVGSGHNGIGTSSWYFSTSYIDSMFSHMLTLGGATNATMTSATTNPRIVFQEGTGTQPVILAYTDQDSYRAPAGLKIVGGTSATPAWLEVEGQLRSNDSIRVIKNGASSDTGPDAIVYIENKDNSDWAQKILLDTANYGLYIQGTGTNLLKVGTNSVLIVQDHASTANSRTATVNGLLKVTNNSNTVTIGSQNANFTHIYNSASIPFIMNNSLLTTTGNLGDTSYPWNNLYIGKAGTKGIYYVGTKATTSMIRFLDNTTDANGNGVSIGGGGQLILGSGEAASNLEAAITTNNGAETAYLLGDDAIYIEGGAQTIANRVGVKVDSSGNVIPVKAETNQNLVQNIGADGVAFKGVYAGNIYLRRQNNTAYGRVSFYQPNYTTWISYMSNAAAGACPTGGTPSTLGDVTNWAQRSIIEQSANYGWIWESCANGAVSENTTKPTPRMALNANNGNLFVRGNVFLSSEAGETDRSLVFAYRDGTTLTNDNGASWRLIHKASGSGDGNYFAIESSTSTTGNSKTWNNVLRAGMNTYNILLSSETDASAGNDTATDAALTVSGGIQTIKSIKIGKFTNTSTAPGYGIKIHDLRDITVTSEIFGQHSVNWYFKQINGNWAASMHMKGWGGGYYSWEIAGNAHNSSIDRYYVRTNSNSAAGTWHTLVYLPAFAAVGGTKKPVYVDANGKVTECGTLVNYAFKTQTEYNAITSPDADTIYFIYESV